MLGHASDACTSNRPLYTYMRDNGLRIGNLQVDVAEFFPCQSRQQLVEREMEYIRHYRPLFNVQVHTDQASILREQHAAHESARARFVGLLRAEKPEVVDYIFQLYLTNKSFRRMFIAVAVELHKSNTICGWLLKDRAQSSLIMYMFKRCQLLLSAYVVCLV